LLIYPLNALVEDQIKRIAILLKDTDITFGKYTGQTPRSKRDAEKENELAECDNHMITREEMRKNPPNILITNYTMLEYMLLRPGDSQIIDKRDDFTFRYLVLDEAHTYSGAQGSEVAFLLQRLRARIKRKAEDIRYIGTSATLGGGDDVLSKTLDFASRLFGTKFQKENVIRGFKKNLLSTFGSDSTNILNINNLRRWELPDSDSNISQLNKYISEILGKEIQSEEIYDILSKESLVRSIIRYLQEEPKDINKLAQLVFTNEKYGSKEKKKALILLISWASFVSNKNGTPILPARYHMFISSSKGMFCKLAGRNEDRNWDMLALIQLEIKEKGGFPFELGVCRVCGKPYIVGSIIGDGRDKYYKPIADSYFESADSNDEFRSKVIFSFEPIDGAEVMSVCSKCGLIGNYCTHSDSYLINLYKIYDKLEYFNNDNEVLEETEIEKKGKFHCSCGYGNSIEKNVILFRFSENGATAPLVSALFKNAPYFNKKRILELTHEIETEYNYYRNYSPIISSGKKILLFSDSRQKAAYYGPYLQVTHNQILFNKFIIRNIKELKEPILIEDLVAKIVSKLNDNADKEKLYSLVLKDLTPTENLKKERVSGIILKKRVYHSIINLIDRTSTTLSGIEGLGFGAVYFDSSSLLNRINIEGISKEQMIVISHLIIRYIRMGQAFLHKYDNGEINLKEDDLYYDALYDKSIYIDPEENTNGRNNSLRLILKNEKKNALQKSLLKYLDLNNGYIGLKKVNELIQKISVELIKSDVLKNNNGKGYKLNVSALSIMPLNISGDFVKTIPGGFNEFKTCKKCGRLSWINIGGICNFSECHGVLTDEKISIQSSDKYNHYRYLYSKDSFDDDLRAVEHTAQLNKRSTAKDYQKEFKRGRINILSCSTTFEMGIDLGDLSIIFMRNVPPSIANYVQRAGRAGRRVGVSPFVVTYCRNLPHDQFYFKNAIQLVNGKVNPPTIVLENEKILKRHFNAVILSDLFTEYREGFSPMRGNYVQDLRIKSFFEINEFISKDETPYKVFKEDWFPSKIDYYCKSLGAIFSTGTRSNLVKEVIDRYLGDLDILNNEKYGLSVFYEDYKSVIDELERLELKKSRERKHIEAGRIKSSIDSKKDNQLISFLSSHGNLPSYAFPNNVVPLVILFKSDHKDSIDLSRNLEVAITEYAPGSDVIANSRVYRSTSLYKFRAQIFPIYYYAKCSSCSWFQCLEANEKNKKKIKILLDEHCQKSGHDIVGNKIRKSIIPKWGFAVDRNNANSKWIKRGTKIERSGYSSELLVNDTAFDNAKEKDITINGSNFKIQYANGYDVFRINEGKKVHNTGVSGFKVCLECGQVINNTTHRINHKTPFGGNCDTSPVSNLSLMSIFDTDLIKVSFLNCPDLPESVTTPYLRKSFWRTLLYAFIEATSKVLEVDRNDLDGVYKSHQVNEFADIVILDSVSGGAGHVLRLFGKGGENPEFLFKKIFNEVKIVLSCNECVAACYSCLFHYSNQSVQHSLDRKPALEWINKIIL